MELPVYPDHHLVVLHRCELGAPEGRTGGHNEHDGYDVACGWRPLFDPPSDAREILPGQPTLNWSSVAGPLDDLLTLPGVADAVNDARETCTALRWHPALRRRIPEGATESRVRGARASAALDGAEFSVDVVRDLMRGAVAWPDPAGPLEQALRSAVRATSQTERLGAAVRSAPSGALARLHVAAAADLAEQESLGRPRTGDQDCRELVELGSAPPASVAAERMRGIAGLLDASQDAPIVVVAAIAHAEIACARPFARGNAVVARAFERALLVEGGLDPTGVSVPEWGHGRSGVVEYLGALAAYATGTPDGVRLWLIHCAEAVAAGAQEGGRICDAVLAGRLN